jgi:uncharacterized membrane protein YphA (DoxX/SURF4 family)
LIISNNSGGLKKLQRLFSTFPAGFPGFGLLLLRVTLGISVIAQGVIAFSAKENQTFWTFLPIIFAVIFGLTLIIGFLTPLFGVVVFLWNIIFITVPFGFHHTDYYAIFYISMIAVAVTIIGPGAFSLDARMFGRREVIIPDR